MIVFKEAAKLTQYLHQIKQKGLSIGFAPTMGALHEGHISLIKKSNNLCDLTVNSIFVNPTQFNDPKDFEKYPITIGNDLLLLESAGCDVVFLPQIPAIYPDGLKMSCRYELGEIEFILEGKFRPGHFQGVSQVVHRLLSIVQPNKLFMGQKDYQQCMVVKQLVHHLQLPVEVITTETFREPSGLAMSSRNLRLSEMEKKQAAGISQMLSYIKANIHLLPFSVLESEAINHLLATGFNKVDYVAIADGDTLQPLTAFIPGRKIVVLIAATIGEIRLIDNTVIEE